MGTTRFTILIAALLVAGCKDTGPTVQEPGDGNGNGETPALSILVSPTTLSLPQGGEGTVTVALSRSGGFVGEIALALEGVPQGVTATASPAVVPAGGSASAISLRIGGAATAGTFTVTVRASGTGIETKSASFSLTVTAVSTPGFTLSVSPLDLTIQQGHSGTSVINVTRTGGFTGTITLSAAGLPAGLNANIDPPRVIDVPSTLTVGANYNAPTGSHTFTVIAAATGQADRTATITVEVTPSNPVGEVSYQFCDASGRPLWFAYQDGSGAWSAVSGINDIFAFDLPSDRGGVAYVLATAGGGYTLDIFWGNQSELNTRGQNLCSGSGLTRTIHGSIAGVSASEQAWLQFPGTTAIVSPVAGSTFSVSDVLDGPFDVLGSRIASGPGGVVSLNRLLFRRGLDPADGSTIPVFDFNGSESFDAEGHVLNISNLGTDQTRLVASYYAAGRAMGAYFADGIAVGGSVRTWPAVPASRQAAGDLHVLTLIASPPGTTPPTQTRGATLLTHAGIDRSVTLGSVLGNVNLSVLAASPSVRLRAQYPLQIEYNTFWNLSAVQVGSGQDRSISMGVTGAYLGGVSVIDLQTPDFTGTSGWNSTWGPRSGAQTDWTFSASGWLAAGGVDRPPFVEGVLALLASRSGQIVP
jgi:hypothetical protein